MKMPSLRARSLRALSARAGLSSLRLVGVAASVWCATSCHTELDTTRQAPPKATLGDDIYGVMCDRLGASAIAEDLTASSYHSICHYDDKGTYGVRVDTAGLPKPQTAKTKEARRLGIAKLERLAQRRGELIRALNAALPDETIDDVTTKADGDTIRFHDALMTFGQTLTPLYESNPFDKKGEPLLPSSTRSLGRLFSALGESPEARDALSRMWGRQGYRPLSAALGAVRSALQYPRLRQLTQASVALLGPNGTASPALQQVLTVTREELAHASPVVSPLPAYAVDAQTLQPNRFMTNSEMAAMIFMRGPVSQDDAFALPGEPPRFISLRDRRGLVVPVGAQVAAPFVDASPFDGLADVDAFGRFIDGAGAPVAIDPPFAIPGLVSGPVDAFGRPEALPYRYVDTTRTPLRSMAQALLPLVDATQYAPPGDANAYASEFEGLMYLFAGAHLQYGAREPALYDYATDTVHAATESCPGCLPYTRFRAEDSAMPDLVHAAGQVLADKDSDVILASFIDLMENHEQVVARLVGAALAVQEIGKAHDALAAQGQEARAEMPYATPIWDEMAAVLDRIVQRPGLTANLLAAMADDTMVSPHGGSQHLGETLSKFMQFRDEMTYDQDNLNGPARNLTVGGSSTADPKTPVDRTAPLAGTNRSCFQRSLQTIHDANGVTACNKDGADVHIEAFGFSLVYPLFGFYDACELFTFDNLAGFYLDSLLDPSHAKRAYLAIKDDALNWLVSTGASIGVDADALFAESAGITGMTLKPTPNALNRLVFFGSASDVWSMPDRDNVNAGSLTDTFVSSLIEPVPTQGCPKVNGVNACADRDETLRLRDGASANGGVAKKAIFLWERYGFYDYLRPVVTVFANEGCSDDLSICDLKNYEGEQIFVDMIEVLHRHWSGKDHGAECSPAGSAKTTLNYCSEAGVGTYEPILADAFAGDLIPALHEFAVAASELSKVVVARGPEAGQQKTGAQVMELLTKILFDKSYASQVGMVDRAGFAGTTWVDGTPQAQLTGYTLFTDALHRIDTRWDGGCDANSGVPIAECQNDVIARKAQWKRARSQMVDQFLAVDGSGTAARFRNPGMAKTSLALLHAIRQQLNAHCPNRESGETCTWAKKEMGDKMAQVISGPLFAAMMDLQEAIRKDETSRRELERFMSYVLGACSAPTPPSFCPAGLGGDDPLQATLASIVDLLQLLSNDDNLSPIFNAMSNMANPESDADPGMADTTIKVLTALSGEQYDRHHVLDVILPRLVTPMDGGQPSPIEVFIDTIADVDRIDASSQDALSSDDYATVFRSVTEFLTSETRGLEQIYTIVQNRPRE